MSEKVFSWLAAAVICSLLLAAGCTSKLVVTASLPGAGSIITPGEGTFRYNRGSLQTIVAAAEPHYHFVNWTGTSVDAGKVAAPDAANTTVDMDADYTLQANFAIDQHTLMVSSTSGGSVGTPGEGSFRYDHGSVQRIVAAAEPDYRFVGWRGTAADAGRVENRGAAETTVKIDADYTLQARYAKTSAVPLALKFTPGDSTTYRVVAERKKSVTFEGSLSTDPALKGGETSDRVEMVFTQQIESVNDTSNAVAKITIEGLNYLSKEKDVTVFDFDSDREEDRNNALAKLIGQSYTIEIAPDGQVIRVVDAKRAQVAVAGRASAAIIASALLKPDVIKQRHRVPALPPTDKNQLHTGDEWSSIKTLSFGMLGPKSYERIYMLKEIKDSAGHQTAIVEMNAIPTSETAEELHKEQAIAAFSEMFDNIETYTGRLKLDLTDGKVQEYIEELRSEWVFLDPSAKGRGDKIPDVLRMVAARLNSLERID